MLISGVRVNDRLLLGLADVVFDADLSRKLKRAHAFAYEALDLTAHERALILSALERPRRGLEGLRERLIAHEAWQPRSQKA